jgi:hypothetical protein
MYHQVGRGHQHRYLGEFDFRYNSQKERRDGTLLALADRAQGEAAGETGKSIAPCPGPLG